MARQSVCCINRTGHLTAANSHFGEKNTALCRRHRISTAYFYNLEFSIFRTWPLETREMLSWFSVFWAGGIQWSKSTNEKFNKVAGTADRKYESIRCGCC